MAFLDKVKNLLAKNADKVDTAIDKAGDMVDKKTQGKYAQHVDKVQDAARKYVDKTNPQQPSQQPPDTPQQQQRQHQAFYRVDPAYVHVGSCMRACRIKIGHGEPGQNRPPAASENNSRQKTPKQNRREINRTKTG